MPITNVLGIEQEQFDKLCKDVLDRMTDFVKDFVTPISMASNERSGIAWGTGNYLLLRNSTYLISNEHVYAEAKGAPLAHLPGPTDMYIHCCHHFQTAGDPIDLCLMRLGKECHDADMAVIQPFQLAPRFAPVEGELLFVAGFPGSRATRGEDVTEYNVRRNLFGPINNLGVPMLAQVCDEPIHVDVYDDKYHAAIHFPFTARKTPEGPEEALPNPKGMSGSFIWDTKLLARIHAGEDWHPEDARVCGLEWGQRKAPATLLFTKIEHICPKLLSFLREESAHYKWIDRGSPFDDTSLIDWVAAEQEIVDLS